MRSFLVFLALGTGLMYGAGPAPLSVVEERLCSSELEALRFVSTPQGSKVPLYGDMNLISYLTQTYRGTQPHSSTIDGTIAFPLYSKDALLFRRGPYLFVTTGLLTRIRDEAGLVHQFQQLVPFAAENGAGQALPHCRALLAVEPIAFESVWSRLRASLLQYDTWAHLRLKRRPSESTTIPADGTR